MIKIYTIPECEHCDKIKSFCKENEISYEEIDLAKKENREAREFYRSLGIRTAPVVVGKDNKGEEIILTELDEDMLKIME